MGARAAGGGPAEAAAEKAAAKPPGSGGSWPGTITLGELHMAVQAAGCRTATCTLFGGGRAQARRPAAARRGRDEARLTVGELAGARRVVRLRLRRRLGARGSRSGEPGPLGTWGGPTRPAPPGRARWPAGPYPRGGCWGFADLRWWTPGTEPPRGEASQWLGEFDPAVFSVEAAEARAPAARAEAGETQAVGGGRRAPPAPPLGLGRRGPRRRLQNDRLHLTP